MNPILAHPSAKSITLTLSSKCLDPVMMRIATLLLTGQHCASHTAALLTRKSNRALFNR
jgi:hypothetical protein